MSLFSSPKVKHGLEKLQESLPAMLGRRFIETDLITHAASLAFFALLSLAPLLILLLWLTASLYPSAQQQLVDQIGQLAGTNAEEISATVIDNATKRPGVGSLAGLWSTLLLFVGATAVFARLQIALNLIFRTDAEQLDGMFAWLRKRVFSIGVVLGLGFLLLISMTMSTALQVVFANMPSILPTIATVATLLIYVFAFAFLYHYLPDRTVAWRQAMIGGVITALLFSGGRYLIGLYIAKAAPGSAYGSMGTLVILLVWIYYATLMFFLGALITAVIDERMRGVRAQPDPEEPEAEGQTA